MLTFLFWNVDGVGLTDSDERYRMLADVIKSGMVELNVDVLIIAESPFEGRLNLPDFRVGNVFVDTRIPGKGRVRLELYHRDGAVALGDATLLDRAMLQTVRCAKTGIEISLALAHLKSMVNSDEATRVARVRRFSSAIANFEDAQHHRRTVVVGDLNYDPWELAVIGAEFLLAVPTRSVAAERDRKITILDSSYRFFYNPMWSHLGDRNNSAGGTYYRDDGGAGAQFCHCFDQVLLRPDLLKFWQDDNLAVLTSIADTSIVIGNRSIPNRVLYSDHLPVLFNLKLEN